jgi:hypothetical protein
MPSAIVFLVWSFGFWPVIGATEYMFVHQLGQKEFLLGYTFYLGIVWVIGMVSSYQVYRIKQGVRHEDDDDAVDESDPNTLLIIEAPNHQQAVAAHGNYIESETYFATPPTKGKRLVLNSEDDDDSNILGTVVEIAEGTHKFGDEKKYRVWIHLDKPEDYAALIHKSGWQTGVGEKRRSTTPPIDLAGQQAPA